MSRVLVVGWDGATWTVADPLAKAGRLPTLSSLMQGGASGELESVPNMNSAPAWSTVVTGVGPGRHGIFYFDEPVTGTYRRTVINASRRTGASLWRIASEAGKRVIVVNVPISYPAEQVNGFLVAGLDTPSKSLPGFAHPEDLPRRYPELFKDYIIEPGAPSLMRMGRVKEARDQLLSSIEGWVSVTERLMRDEEWDLVFVVFTSTDTAQHFFWSDEGRRVIDRVYEVQDEATARLVELARRQDPDVQVAILADHGGAANSRGPEYLPIWLEDQGLLSRTRRSLKSRGLTAGYALANRTLTRNQKQALARRFGRLRETAEAESRLAGIDWPRTRAYADGRRDEVLINRVGRDPEGTISEGEYPGFVHDLREALASLTEVDTGRPAVVSVVHRSDAYHGPFVDRAPDLTIRWSPEGPLRGLAGDSRKGLERMREAAARPPFQPGGHHPMGMFVANGTAVAPASVNGRLEDVAPTVLAFLGVPIPGGMDGRPLVVAGTEANVAGFPADLSGPTTAARDDSGYTAEEEEAVRRRLEALGYL
jgi:predicted AlkP superfamily phosphohydrolase/phosphomutase